MSRLRILFLMALGWQSCAVAGLGDTAQSVAVDRAALHGGGQQTSTAQYSVDTISDAAGGSILEYSTSRGVVFAVTWRGPNPPNLQQLFGAYYDRYRTAAAASAHTGDHHHMSVVQDDLTVQAVARERFYRGRAFVRSLVPDGVSVSDLP
jgi:Protein of unknown function (DUF2844)